MLGPERFNTLIGLVFLVIVLLSPGGLVGLWEQRARPVRATKARWRRATQSDRGGAEGDPAAGSVK